MKLQFVISNIESTAFRAGFVNGLGAPVLLFSDFHCPTIRSFHKTVGEHRHADGLQQDWNRIGEDFRVAVNRHVEAA